MKLAEDDDDDDASFPSIKTIGMSYCHFEQQVTLWAARGGWFGRWLNPWHPVLTIIHSLTFNLVFQSVVT